MYRTNTSPTRVVSVDERNGRVADNLTHQLGPLFLFPSFSHSFHLGLCLDFGEHKSTQIRNRSMHVSSQRIRTHLYPELCSEGVFFWTFFFEARINKGN